MRLPDIEYGGPVPSAAPALAAEDQARRQALTVYQGAAEAFSRELVRTKAQAAAADLKAGLAQAEEEIARKPYASTAEIRETLGEDGFSRLPEDVRKQLQDTLPDGSQVDREEVPTWLVAGALFEKRAKDLAGEAAAQIPGSGWQAEFLANAGTDIEERRGRLARQQFTAMQQDMQREQLATVEQLTRGRAWDEALRSIDSSRLWMPGEKAGLRERVLAAKQKAEEGDRENRLASEAEQMAQALELKYPGDPRAAVREAQALPGAMAAKVSQRLTERENQRTEAEGDAFRVAKDGLELAIRDRRIRSVTQLEGLDAFKGLPDGPKADLVQILNSETERAARLAQMRTAEQWKPELEAFKGLSDREKVKQYPVLQGKVPAEFAGEFAQVEQAARTRLSNAFDSEDARVTIDTAVRAVGWGGERNAKAARLRDAARRWYDGETLRAKGVPPTLQDVQKWLAERLAYGDENGDAYFGGDPRTRFDAELEAARTGRPVPFVPYSGEKQKYAPSAQLLRGEEPGGPPAAAPPAPAARAVPGKVQVVGPNGVEGSADEAGLDAWLEAHPGWSRKQ